MTAHILSQVPVTLAERSYQITIGQALFAHPAKFFPEGKKSAFIITDDNVAVHAGRLAAALEKLSLKVETLVVKPGEASKSFAQFENLLEQLLEKGIKRQSVVVAVGGGVIGDLAGYTAASVLRGVDFVQVPTSLLAMVDSSVGGKTGINSKQGKNLIGAFYQPKSVMIDLDVLAGLPDREMRAGYAEIVKYGLLGDLAFFEWLEKNGAKVLARDPDALAYAIKRSCEMKADIVRQDEREETGLRALLNLGHTFAHALEAACHYDGRLLHGEAVSIGLVLAARLSAKMGLIADDSAARVSDHLKAMGLMSEIRQIPNFIIDPDSLMGLMSKDKKATDQGLHFVVMQKFGQAALRGNVPPGMVASVLQGSL